MQLKNLCIHRYKAVSFKCFENVRPNFFYLMYYIFQDLNYLNRDLSKVIMIDWNPESVSINPENSFLLKQWTGEDRDTTLGELAEFLRGGFLFV